MLSPLLAPQFGNKAQQQAELQLRQRVHSLQTRFFGSLNAADVFGRIGQLTPQRLDTPPADTAAHKIRQRLWGVITRQKPAALSSEPKTAAPALAQADLLAFYPAFQKPHLRSAVDFLAKQKLVTLDSHGNITPDPKALALLGTVLNTAREWDNRTRTPFKG